MRVALLGASHWHAGFHAEAVRAAGAELVAVWDADPAVAATFAGKWGGRAVASVAAAVAEAPDLAVGLGRGPDAAALLAELLTHDVKLLMDKPIGLSAADVAPLLATAVSRGRFVAVALAHRTGPIPAALARLSAAGRLGAISHMQYRIINGPPQRYPDWGVGWMLDRGQSGGGALRNLGVHGLDAFVALAAGQRVEVVHASFGRGVHRAPVEDFAHVVLRAADGMLGIVEAGYTWAHPQRGGVFEWRVDAQGASLADDGTQFTLATTAEAAVSTLCLPGSQRYAAFMADTLARGAAGRPPLVDLAAFAAAMRLTDDAYRMGGL